MGANQQNDVCNTEEKTFNPAGGFTSVDPNKTRYCTPAIRELNTPFTSTIIHPLEE